MLSSRPFLIVVLGATIASFASRSFAETEIVRIAKTPPRPTLDAVILPPNAEVMLISGQGADPLDPTKIDGPDDFGNTKTQTLSILTKIKHLLEAHGYSMKNVVKLTVFVAGDPKLDGKGDFAGMNEVYATFFGTIENPNLPTRSAIQVAALGRPGYRVEIEATAARVPAKRGSRP